MVSWGVFDDAWAKCSVVSLKRTRSIAQAFILRLRVEAGWRIQVDRSEVEAVVLSLATSGLPLPNGAASLSQHASVGPGAPSGALRRLYFEYHDTLHTLSLHNG